MLEKILISALRKVVSDTTFFNKKYTGTMYHGSVVPVTTWHTNTMGQFGKGLYLALDRKWAEFHAEGGRQGKAGQRPSKEKGYVYEFQVSGNALVIRDEEEFFKELIGENEEAEDAFSRTGDLYSKAISRCTADYARDKGYDLVIFDPKNSDVLTPFPQAIILNPKSFKLKNKPTVKAETVGANLIGYHGTPRSKFDALKMDQKPTSKQIYGKGLYFTSKKNSAITFAVGKHGQVFTVDLSNLTLWDARHDLKTTTALAKKLKIKSPTSEEINNDGWNYLIQQRGKQLPDVMVEKLIEALKSLGFDGTIVPFQSATNLPNGRVIEGEDWYVIYKNEDKIKYLKKESKLDC